MRRKKQKPPICIGGSERLRAADVPPLHERTFARSLPRKRGRCREAIGMGFAHHCVYLTFHSHIISRIRQDPKVGGGPGVNPGFAASDAAVLFGYTTHPFGTRAGNPTPIS
jgi:hypothetical protein